MKKDITVVGLDLAKSVFQVHGIGNDGEVVVRRKLSRSRVLAYFSKLAPCLIGMEACATAHHWAREISALGHEVNTHPPQIVNVTEDGDPANPEMGPSQWGPAINFETFGDSRGI